MPNILLLTTCGFSFSLFCITSSSSSYEIAMLWTFLSCSVSDVNKISCSSSSSCCCQHKRKLVRREQFFATQKPTCCVRSILPVGADTAKRFCCKLNNSFSIYLPNNKTLMCHRSEGLNYFLNPHFHSTAVIGSPILMDPNLKQQDVSILQLFSL